MKPFTNKLDSAITMFRTDYQIMCDNLKDIQSTLGHGQDIDIRLCVDFEDTTPSWIIRSGDASYDQRHSDVCGASSIDKKTKLKSEPACEVLEELINQCLDQIHELI